MYKDIEADLALFACPDCKGPLHLASVALCCTHCKEAFPIFDGIPDFLLEELDRNGSRLARWSEQYYDHQAGFYEWPRWPLVLALYGGWGAPSFKNFLTEMMELMSLQEGLVLDVACGPGTLGRRFASPSRTVYAIDISWGALLQGLKYANQEMVHNIHYARARAEKLPFNEEEFDGAFCGAALHLFPDPLQALVEIACRLKPGAPLVGSTIIAGESGILKYKAMRKHALQDGYHLFTPVELEDMLRQAGFRDVLQTVYGSLVLFRAEKKNVV